MAVLWQNIKLRGSKGERIVNALFDSGSTYSFVRKDIAEKIGQIDNLPEPMKFTTAKKDKKIKVKLRIAIDFYLNNARFSDEFLVSNEIKEEAIIGAKTMQSWRFKLDFKKEKISFDHEVTKRVII